MHYQLFIPRSKRLKPAIFVSLLTTFDKKLIFISQKACSNDRSNIHCSGQCCKDKFQGICCLLRRSTNLNGLDVHIRLYDDLLRELPSILLKFNLMVIWNLIVVLGPFFKGNDFQNIFTTKFNNVFFNILDDPVDKFLVSCCNFCNLFLIKLKSDCLNKSEKYLHLRLVHWLVSTRVFQSQVSRQLFQRT